MLDGAARRKEVERLDNGSDTNEVDRDGEGKYGLAWDMVLGGMDKFSLVFGNQC